MEHERGSMTPLLALVVVGVGGLCVGLGHLGAVANAAARAQTAADAAALAGAADGLGAARRLAEANGAEIVELRAEEDGTAGEGRGAGHRGEAGAPRARRPGG